MKKIFNIKDMTLLVSFFLGGMLAGCDDAEYSTLDPHAYLQEAQKSHGTSLIVQATGTTSTTVTVRVSDKASEDCSFMLVADQAVLDRYNARNGTGYIQVPTEYYILPQNIVIQKGKYESEPISIEIKPFSEEMASSGESYAIPLRLKSADGKVPAMDQSATYVIATGSIIKFSAPVLNGDTPVSVDMSPGILTLSEFTVEMRFQIQGFYENQALFNGGGSGDSQVYIRLEDPVGTYNLIQIVGKKTYLNALTPFENNKWQHLAISFNGSKYLIYVNGKLDAQKEVGAGAVTFSNIQFISSGSWFRYDCLLSEVRLWGKALNENQIQNNMTVVSPKSEGLEAYWKMNEGSGNVFHDATGKGYTATAEGTVRWIPNILSTDVSTPWE